VIVANMLQRAKIIDSGTQSLVNIFAGVGFGVDVAGTLLDSIGNFIGTSSSGSGGPDVMRPSATSLTYIDQRTIAGAPAPPPLPAAVRIGAPVTTSGQAVA